MAARFNHIAEAYHRSHNPLMVTQYHLLGEMCGFEEKQRILDLACGKGEGLVQWSREFGVVGVGVDTSPDHIAAAQQRAYQLDVGNTLNFVVGEPADYPEAHHAFDYVSYMGSTWLGDSLPERLDKLKAALKPRHGLLLLGETYWQQRPTEAACDALGVPPNAFITLPDLLQVVQQQGYELIEMLLPDLQQIDRYEASQWMAVNQFLRENPDDPEAEDLQRWITANRWTYLSVGRDFLGWGVFVLRPTDVSAQPMAPTRQHPNQPVAVNIDDHMIWVSLADGRVIGNPVSWYPTLQQADPTAYEQIELDTSRVHWPALDLTLSVSQMLHGRH